MARLRKKPAISKATLSNDFRALRSFLGSTANSTLATNPMEHDSASARHAKSSADASLYHGRALSYQRRYSISTTNKSVALEKIIEERLSLYLDPVTLIHVANLYHDRLDKYWNITQALSDYFQRPTLLRDVLRKSGSFIFVPHTEDLAQHLTAVEGYIKTEFEGPLEYVVGNTKVKHLEKQKTLRDGLITTVRITLVQGEPGANPFWTVLDKISTTAQLNMITADHAYSMFPHSTFQHERTYRLKDLPRHALVQDDIKMAGAAQATSSTHSAGLLSFQDYRIDLKRHSTPASDSTEHLELSSRRAPGDKLTWTIDFEAKSSSGINDIMACGFSLDISGGGAFFPLSVHTSDLTRQDTSKVFNQPRSGGFPLLSRQLQNPRASSSRAPHVNHSRQLESGRATETTNDVDMSDDHDSFTDHAERLLSRTPERAVNDKCEARRRRIEEIKIELGKMASELPSLSPGEAEEVQSGMFLAELWLALIQTELDITLASFEAVRSGSEVALQQPRRRVALGWLSESIKRLENPSRGVDPLSRNLFKEISNVFMAGIINSEADMFFTGRALPPFLDIVRMLDARNPRDENLRNGHLGPTLTRLTRLKFVNDQSIEEVLLRIEKGMAFTDLAPFISPKLFGLTDPRSNSPLYSQSGRPRLNYDTIDPALLEGDPDNETWLSQKTQENEVGRARGCSSDVSEANGAEAQNNPKGLSEDIDRGLFSTQQRDLRQRHEQMEGPNISQANPLQTMKPVDDGAGTPRHLLSSFRQSQAERDAAFQKEMRRSNGRIPDYLFVTPSPTPPPEPISAPLIDTIRPIQPLEVMTGSEEEARQQSYTKIEEIFSDSTSMHFEMTIDPYEDEDLDMQDVSNVQYADDVRDVQETLEVPTTTPPTSQALPRTRSRRSEPIVLISTPARPIILDSDFVSEDEDNGPPASSHPQLAAVLQESSARALNINTPGSSASAIRTPKPKLPPHLAPTRIAAHRRSLDPSFQIPSPEEKEKLSQEEYPLVDIIDEKLIDGVKKYLIKWKPISGRQFANTWEPAENANAAAVEDWHRRLANRAENAREQRNKQARKIAKETDTAPVLEPSMQPDPTDLWAVRTYDMKKWSEKGSKGKKPAFPDGLREQVHREKEGARLERIAKKAASKRAGVRHGPKKGSAEWLKSREESMALQAIRESEKKREKTARKKENKAKKMALRETQKQAAEAAANQAGPSNT
ncbi:hypothetical protein E4T42_04749 [Aureobasidium subglaciale]|nr:hypothetical protein E4T42_04749 [Aureobasidium subglaciale]